MQLSSNCVELLSKAHILLDLGEFVIFLISFAVVDLRFIFCLVLGTASRWFVVSSLSLFISSRALKKNKNTVNVYNTIVGLVSRHYVYLRLCNNWDFFILCLLA